MEFRRIRALRGPNIWAYSPVLEAYIDLKEWKDISSAMVPGFPDRLMAWLPGLIEHECSEEHRGGFLVRLNEGTYPAHILEHVALELQCRAGTEVGYGRARVTTDESVYRIVMKYRVEEVGRKALEAGRDLILAAFEDRPYDVETLIAELRDLAYLNMLGPSTREIVEAAEERGIPTRRLNSESLVMLGQGIRQRRIVTAETDRTSAVAMAIAQDKELTRSLLRSVGIPVPSGGTAESGEDTWETAMSLGTPVVVKPRDGNHGQGVALNLSTREQVIEAYEAARQEGNGVLVEGHAPGHDHRLLVVDGKFVAAARREPAHVIGDGLNSVSQLLDRLNADPLRGDGYLTALKRVEADPRLVADQGFDLNSIPLEGVRIWMGRKINYFNGGSSVDVTNAVHPEVAHRAEMAAKVVGLDIAGIDIVALDISRPLEDQDGVIVEVNAGPGLQMHLHPSCPPKRVGEAIVASLFAKGENGRIPIAAITGVNGKTTVTRLIAHIVRTTGKTVGMTCTDGIYIDTRRITVGDCSGPKSARDILINPTVEVAVLECARGGILREGLGFDRCDVGVVTNIGEGDHLGLDYINTVEDLVRVKGLIAEVVLPSGWAVLNATDPLVAGMIDRVRGCGVIYFARDGLHPVIVAHREKGGRAAFEKEGAIVLAEGANERMLTSLNHVPLTRGGRVVFQVENAITAAAAAWGLGIADKSIVAGLASFDSEPSVTPGRFNVLSVNDATVIVDFGHNPDAVAALAASIDAFEGKRRTLVLSADGDRSDAVIMRQAELLAPAFDRIILHEEPVRNRGRKPGEIPALLRQGIDASGKKLEVVEVYGEVAAVTHAMNEIEPGDVLLLIIDAVESSLALIQNLVDERIAAQSKG